jgi:Photoprotection regulator fluorescence recovery protein
MQTTDIEWSKTEELVAKKAFDTAYDREITALMEMVRSKANAMTQLDEMWSLHDFLSAKRHDIDGKYDYKYSFLIFVFAQLVKEGWLNLSDLEGLQENKIAKITALSRM